MKRIQILAIGILLSMLLLSCGGGHKWQKSPVDELIRKNDKVESYSIILYDMDLDEGFSDVYKHQYKVVKMINDKPEEEITDWYEVSPEFFKQNENNMGMELAAKSKDGKISKQPAPPGYSNYVGNTHYGSWGSDGAWHFFAQYAMMSMMFNMMSAPIYQSHWNDYRTNYYGRQPYYGQAGSQWSNSASRPSSYSRRVQNNQRLRSSGSGSSWSSSRSSRSSSRWGSGGSSFRSRGGGFGK